MRGFTAFRRWLAGLLLVAVALLAIGMPAYQVTIDAQFWQKARGQEDEVARAIRRVRPVFVSQPRGISLGYLSNKPLWSYEWMEHYFRAQFALAPDVLYTEPGDNQIVLIDADDDAQAERLAAGHGWTHGDRLAEGVIVARRSLP